jgi:hypothetical protein
LQTKTCRSAFPTCRAKSFCRGQHTSASNISHALGAIVTPAFQIARRMSGIHRVSLGLRSLASHTFPVAYLQPNYLDGTLP